MYVDEVVLEVRSLVASVRGRGAQGEFRVGPIDLDVRRGEVLALVGRSGAGKSTLLSAMSGSLQLDEGSANLRSEGASFDLHTCRASDWRRLRRHLGFVYQDPSASLNPRRRVVDVVADPLRIHGLASRRAARARATAHLRAVGLEGGIVERTPPQLSGGQCQRVALARALVHEPRVVFLDEPTSSLDPVVQASLLATLANLRNGRTSFVLVTHDLRVVRAIADRVARIDGGVLAELNDVESFFAQAVVDRSSGEE